MNSRSSTSRTFGGLLIAAVCAGGFSMLLAQAPKPSKMLWAPSQTPGISKMLTTKHNLGASGLGSIKAESEDQLCVFCHTPHVPAGYGADQLWNHELSNATYTLYSSDYLTDLSYSTPNQPNARSRLCLSCHDGTVALGAVYNNQGTTLIKMQNNVTTMPSQAEGYLGTSLANDHPVGFVYDNTRDPELVARSWPWGTPVKLDPDAASGTVECMTCHEPHDNQYGKFLRIDNTNAQLCTFCHTKVNWGDAIHRTSTQPYTPAGGSLTTVGEQSCRNCHKSHNGEGIPYLLTKVEEKTCYESGCHGSNATGQNTKDIQTDMEKSYRHPTDFVTGKHRDPDLPATLSGANQHAECQDCHNSHQARKDLHTAGSNLLSGVLRGVSGVSPIAAPAWSQPSSFTTLKPALYENEVCFKCHSSYALGIVPDGVTTTVSRSGIPLTDQAMEFNPANRSAHPVTVSSGAQSGALIPKGLMPDQLMPPWNAPGTQTMYCSDCHGTDQPATPSSPQGPHGSNIRFMLTGPAKFWPTNPFGDLWSLDDIRNNRNNWQNDLFCVNCHPMAVAGQFTNNVHDASEHQGASVKCITCHVAVPHGAKRSRLIGYSSDVPPYNYSGIGQYDKLVITGFRKATGSGDYLEDNCSMVGVCHGTRIGTYEP